jgi:hypothetical protein
VHVRILIWIPIAGGVIIWQTVVHARADEDEEEALSLVGVQKAAVVHQVHDRDFTADHDAAEDDLCASQPFSSSGVACRATQEGGRTASSGAVALQRDTPGRCT